MYVQKGNTGFGTMQRNRIRKNLYLYTGILLDNLRSTVLCLAVIFLPRSVVTSVLLLVVLMRGEVLCSDLSALTAAAATAGARFTVLLLFRARMELLVLLLLLRGCLVRLLLLLAGRSPNISV